MSYAEGFEDAVELVLDALTSTKSLEDLRKNLGCILQTVKRRKFDRLKLMLESR